MDIPNNTHMPMHAHSHTCTLTGQDPHTHACTNKFYTHNLMIKTRVCCKYEIKMRIINSQKWSCSFDLTTLWRITIAVIVSITIKLGNTHFFVGMLILTYLVWKLLIWCVIQIFSKKVTILNKFRKIKFLFSTKNMFINV